MNYNNNNANQSQGVDFKNMINHYVGNGQQKNPNYDIVGLRLYLDNVSDDVKQDEKGRNYVDLNVGRKKAVDQFGWTHSVWVKRMGQAQQQPQQTAQQPVQQQQQQPTQSQGNQQFSNDNVPF